VGFNKKIENISHHALFLMWILSACKRYYDCSMAKEPCFTLISSLTDSQTPEGMESGFFIR
jgi:phytoene desaturase